MAGSSETRESELEAVRQQLAEANATLDAIRSGQVDAVVVDQGDEDQVYTLQSADLPYREFIEQMDEGALSLDEAGTVLYCNRYFAELVGLKRSLVVGQALATWLSPNSRRLFDSVLSNGQVRQIAVDLAPGDGSTVPIRLGVVPRAARGNRRTIVVVSDQTIAERLQHEIHARDVAEAESHAKDRFLAVLGHELRNPVAALATSVDLLQSRPLDAHEGQRIYAGMSRQLFQLQSLIDDLLDLSRVVHDKIELNLKSVDVDSILTQSREAVASMVLSRNHQLLVKPVPPDLFVLGDRARLEQIVVNLLTNAVRYTPPGGRIVVEAIRVDDQVVITVADSGIGIEADRREAVFEPFVQLGAEGMGGLGIGLTLVRQLVNLHNGTIGIESPGPGLGTTFRVRLPASEEAGPESARPSVRPAQSSVSNDVSVLVVDDNTDAAELMTLLLESRGCNVTTAFTGAEALSIALNRELDIVFLDLGLPDMAGYEVAKQLKARRPSTRVIALTGFSHEEARAKVKEAGFDAHVIKPLRLNELDDMLVRYRPAK